MARRTADINMGVEVEEGTENKTVYAAVDRAIVEIEHDSGVTVTDVQVVGLEPDELVGAANVGE